MIRLHALPLPPHSSGDTQEDLERETTCLRERREGGERGAESYDLKKAWPSINHSILSVPGEPRWRAGEIWSMAGRTLDFPLDALFLNDCIPQRARLVQKEEENWGQLNMFSYAKKEER